MSKTILLIDPPSGWKYGFPKPYDNPTNIPVAQWLIENGYPKSELNKDGNPYWVRYLQTSVEE